jgi:hypothetical protein
VMGETSYAMVWLWFIGAGLLGAVLAYGVIRAGNLRRSERARLDRNTVKTQQAEDPRKRPF